ncbi:MAG: ABC transporter permease [Tissierellales bacterium]|nr:ABC transporter permease [Tissierellales bacterium]
MNFRESISIAIKAIWINKMRSLLTMLGIIIGIASVIAVVALGNGTESAINGEFESFGVNRVYLFHNYQEEITTKDQMTKEDYNSIRRAMYDKIEHGSITFNKNGTMVNKLTKKEVDLTLNGVNEEYDSLGKIEVIEGRFLSDSDLQSKRQVAVIDDELAMEIFGKKDVVGSKIVTKMNSQNMTFIVVGVYEKPKSMFSGMGGMEEPKNIYVPLSVIEQTLGLGNYVYTIEISLKSTENIESDMEQITSLLERKHGNVGEEKYRILSAEGQMEVVNGIMGMLTLVIGAIAAISLLVGGIGVMNIMLVSVTERTREIGIRKALGAKHKDIMMQFLVESIIVSGVGGIIGTLLGMGLAQIISAYIQIPPSTGVGTIAIAWIFSAGVGIFFGLYPANKAAKLDPIEALRYE